MKYLFIGLLLSSFTLINSNHMPIKVMTYNIRYANEQDGENKWANRKSHLMAFINEKSPDFLGLQEALQSQVDAIDAACTDYQWIGVGREDGDTKGEYASIFYRKDKFQVLELGTFWLSETPEIIGTKGWDAALPRVATWARFQQPYTDKRYLVVNTHFDHKGRWARQKSARLILKKVNELKEKGDLVIIMGDFNITPRDEVYRVMTQNSGFADTKDLSKYPPLGPRGTFNGFKKVHAQQRIDYIFTPPLTNILSYQVFQPKYDNKQVSDHYPVMIELYD